MSSTERKERGEKEVEAWTEEMGNEDALEVGHSESRLIISL